MNIKAVYFDFGGVIARTEDRGPRTRLAEQFGMTYREMDEYVFKNDSSQRASIGEITEPDHWAGLVRGLNLPLEQKDEFRSRFFEGDVIDRDLLELIGSLRPRFKTGLISNAWDGLRDILATEKIDVVFDTLVISAEVGIVKPDPRIYQYALDQLDVLPEESVFVDDFSENIKGARDVGMKAVHFLDPQIATAELKAHLGI
jgi:glucose-1-phosphatase